MALRFIAVALLFLILACSSCSNGSGSYGAQRSPRIDDKLPPGAAPQSEAPQGSLSLLPLPSTLLSRGSAKRSSYAAADLLREAEEFDAALPNQLVTADGDGLHFAPAFTEEAAGFAGLSFALLRYQITDYDGHASVFYQWRDEPADITDVYLGFSNWAADRWEFFRLDDLSRLDLPSFDDCFAPDGTMLIAVMLTGTSQAELDWLRIGSLPPVAAITSDEDFGLTPLSVSFDASGSSDPDSSIVEYLWDPEGDGEFEVSTGDVPQFSHIYESEGPRQPAVRVVDNNGVYGEASMTVEAKDSLFIPLGSESMNEYGVSVVALPDGELMVIGSRAGEDFDTADVCVARLSIDPEVAFVRQWGGPGRDECNRAKLGPDGNVYVCGRTDSYGVGGHDALLQKWSPDGELLWSRTYGLEDGSEEFKSLVVTSSSVYLCGDTELDALAKYLGLAVCTDLDGNLVWTRTTIAPSHSILIDLAYLEGVAINDTFIAACGSYYPAAGNSNALYVKLSETGDIISAREWGVSPQIDQANAISFTGAATKTVYVSGYGSGKCILGVAGGSMYELSAEGLGIVSLTGMDLLGRNLLVSKATTDIFTNDTRYSAIVLGFDQNFAILNSAELTSSGNYYARSLTSFSGNRLVAAGSLDGSLPGTHASSIEITASATSWTDVFPASTSPSLVTTNTQLDDFPVGSFSFNNFGNSEMGIAVGRFDKTLP